MTAHQLIAIGVCILVIAFCAFLIAISNAPLMPDEPEDEDEAKEPEGPHYY